VKPNDGIVPCSPAGARSREGRPDADVVARHVAARLRRRRRKLGLTPEELDARIGALSGTTERFETAKRAIGASQLYLLGEALGVEAAFFFQGLSGARRAAGGTEGVTAAEIIRFLKAYAAVGDRDVREKIYTLVKAAAEPESGGGA